MCAFIGVSDCHNQYWTSHSDGHEDVQTVSYFSELSVYPLVKLVQPPVILQVNVYHINTNVYPNMTWSLKNDVKPRLSSYCNPIWVCGHIGGKSHKRITCGTFLKLNTAHINRICSYLPSSGTTSCSFSRTAINRLRGCMAASLQTNRISEPE